MPDLPFQTKTDIQHRLTAVGRAPNTRRGQHFLIDRNLMKKLVAAADIQPTACVVEVGAGTGSLTGMLASLAGEVVTAEIDHNLAEPALAYASQYGHVTLVQGDALAGKNAVSPELLAAIREARSRKPGRLILAANLPYEIATPLVIELLIGELPFDRFAFTVQAEVADRLLAESSTRDYGPAGIIVQAFAEGRRVARVPPEAFWPRPRVHSTLVCLDARPRPAADTISRPAFARFVRSFFLHRRKTMAHNIKSMDERDGLLEALASLEINPTARPENLTVDQWLAFFTQSSPRSK